MKHEAGWFSKCGTPLIHTHTNTQTNKHNVTHRHSPQEKMTKPPLTCIITTV